MSENEIIGKIQSGNPLYFEKLIRNYNTTLYRTGISFLGNEHDVQDAMQNTYLKAFEKLSKYRGESQFSTWIVKIMINECLMILRKRIRQDNFQEILDVSNLNKSNYSDKILNNEMREVLEKSIQNLPSKYRSVFVFREVHGYSTQKTAELLDITVPNVKIRLIRAKLMLKKEVRNYFSKEDLFEFYRPKCDPLTKSVMEKILSLEGNYKLQE